MAKSISASAKREGRPVTTGSGTAIGVRMLDAPLATLDAWIAKQKQPYPSRPEAIRRLVELGLKKGKESDGYRNLENVEGRPRRGFHRRRLRGPGYISSRQRAPIRGHRSRQHEEGRAPDFRR